MSVSETVSDHKASVENHLDTLYDLMSVQENSTDVNIRLMLVLIHGVCWLAQAVERLEHRSPPGPG